jgi:hypothetical protein
MTMTILGISVAMVIVNGHRPKAEKKHIFKKSDTRFGKITIFASLKPKSKINFFSL